MKELLIERITTFNITPTKAEDDYDFMLFKCGKNNFCDSLQKHKINPIRACISRDKEELNGKTGLNYNMAIQSSHIKKSLYLRDVIS